MEKKRLEAECWGLRPGAATGWPGGLGEVACLPESQLPHLRDGDGDSLAGQLPGCAACASKVGGAGCSRLEPQAPKR